MAWRIPSGVMQLSAAQKFSQLLHFFKETKEGRRRDGVSLSLMEFHRSFRATIRRWHFRPGQHRGLQRPWAWAWSLRHPLVTLPLCHFSTFSNPSCGKRQSTTASGCHQCHSARYLQAQTWPPTYHHAAISCPPHAPCHQPWSTTTS